MGDLVVDGKPLEKLLDVVSNAIGALCAPWQIKRVARAEAEADRIKAIESAKTKALLAENAERYKALSTIEKRIIAKEEKRQNNINNVVAVAAQSLKDEKDVSSEQVNPDWATRFFDIAQDISDEAMQDLWGRILAGEVKRPKSYSLRTLEVLRNITREEAELFEKMAQYVMRDASYYIFQDSFEKNTEIGYQYMEISRLMEIGLVQSSSTIVNTYYNNSDESSQHYIYYGEKYVAFVEMPTELKQMSFPIYPLTRVGEELYKLVSPAPNREYFEYVLHKILEDNKHFSKRITTKYAKLNWIDYTKGLFEYDSDTIREIV